jgi:hypothetical protein
MKNFTPAKKLKEGTSEVEGGAGAFSISERVLNELKLRTRK